jgi:hypothetical protein
MSKLYSPNVTDFLQDLKYWYSVAGNKARHELLRELQDIPIRSDNVDEHRLGEGYDFSFAIDFSNDFYRLGRCYVYAFVTESGLLYYIGEGDFSRIYNPHRENIQFQDMYEKNHSKIFILAKGLDKETAQNIETLLIWEAQMAGCSLTNTAKKLTEVELQELRLDLSQSLITDRYHTLCDDFAEVLATFKKFRVECLKVALSSQDEKEQSTFVDRKRSNRKCVRELWTIDGITKSATEWCKIYNTSVSKVSQRMRNWGCTPREALEFPPVPHCSRIPDAVSWLKSRGFIPGADKTSKITPLSEWPSGYRLRG